MIDQRDLRQPQPVGRGEGREEVPEGGAVMTRVTVGLSTCGIAAGAEDTYKALEAKLAALPDAPELTRTGCVGMCYQEPLVEISNGDGERYLYGHISPDKVDRLLDGARRAGAAGRRLAGLDRAAARAPTTPTSRASTGSCCATAATSTPSRSTSTSRSGGYLALQKVLEAKDPDGLINAMIESGLRGRGGAGLPDRDEVALHAPGAGHARSTSSATRTRATRARSWTARCSRATRTRSSRG